MEVKYNSSLRGQVYRSDYAGVYYPSEDGLFHDVVWVDKVTESVLTGYYVQTFGGNVYLQTTGGWWMLQGDSSWSKLDMSRVVATVSDSQAQKMIDQMIENNKHVLANNLVCARYANKLNSEQRKTLYELQQRLEDRNAALKNDGFVTEVKVSYPEGYANLGGYLENFMQQYGVSGVGVTISTTAMIVIACLVLTGFGTAAYFAYKAYWQESKDDVKFSDELTAVLASKLTEEEYQQLQNETAGIVTRAKIKSTLTSNTKLIGAGLIFLGVLTVMNLWRGGTLRR